MKFKRLFVKNFLSIGEIDLDFGSYNGLVLVEGVNKDSKASESNGAGKSSIFEAIYWVLFGKTKRGLIGDNVINFNAGKDCVVILEFDDCKVIRARKHKEYGDNLLFYKAGKDLSKGSIKDTQLEINKHLNMSELTFLKTISFGQGDVKPFASLTDKELKEVFEQALKLTDLSLFAEKIKTYKRGLEMDKTNLELKYENLNNEIARVDKMIEDIKQELDNFTENNKKEIKKHEAELLDLIDETKKLEDEIAKMDDVKKQMYILEEKLKSFDDVRQKIEKLEQLEKDKIKEYTLKEMALEKYKETLEKMKQEIEQASGKIGQKCEACDRVFKKDDIDGYLQALKNRSKEIIPEFEKTRQEKEACKKELDEIEAFIKHIEGKMDEYNKIKDLLYGLKLKSSKYDLFVKQFESNKKQINQIRDNISYLRKQTNPYKKQLDKLNEEKIALERSIGETQKLLNDINDELVIVNALVNIFGTSGLKGYVFENITPELNRIANEYARILDDILIEISTVTKLKSGEIRDKFSINVDNLHGAKVFNGNSGGEQQKINLAISLAFNTLLRGMSSNAPDIIFLDEPFESLDAGSSERVVELCEKFGENLGKVFIITHNQSLKDIIPTVLKVVKENGYSKIM